MIFVKTANDSEFKNENERPCLPSRHPTPLRKLWLTGTVERAPSKALFLCTCVYGPQNNEVGRGFRLMIKFCISVFPP